METKNIKNDEMFQRVLASSLMIVIAIVSFLLTARFISTKPKDVSVDVSPSIDVNKISQNVETMQTELDKLKTMKSVDIYENGLVTPDLLITNCRAEGASKNSCDIEISKITKKLYSSGKTDRAKLYIKAGVSRNDGPLKPLTQYDSIWFFLDNTDLAGHLIRAKALFSGQSEDGLSEYVFDMSNLPLTNTLPYNDNSTPNYRDAVIQINAQQTHLIAGFISTLGYGKIEKMIVYYEGYAELGMSN